MLDWVCKRKTDPRTQQRMKFFEKHLNHKQCKQVRNAARPVLLC